MFENTKLDSHLPVVNYLGICIIFGLNWAIGSLGHFTRSIHSCKLKDNCKFPYISLVFPCRQNRLTVSWLSIQLKTALKRCGVLWWVENIFTSRLIISIHFTRKASRVLHSCSTFCFSCLLRCVSNHLVIYLMDRVTHLWETGVLARTFVQ